ncbi:MAG TPA: heparinase II/III family protein, partial [Rhizomicrobium sp.]|nr:heparinase II/III family protein [Rhizomicrobium sp.]
MARGAGLDLLPEMMEAGARRLLAPLRTALRASALYRQLLKGPLADHLAFQPHDPGQGRLEDADALLRGRFRFHGQSLEVPAGVSIFELPPPSREWSEALHAFAWLPPLALAGGEAARTLTTNLIAQWVRRHARYTEPPWSAHVMARRLLHLFSHGRHAIANSEMTWRSKLFVSLREQSRMLERIAAEAPEGLPRLEAAAALALSGLCLEPAPARLAAGLRRLEEECQRQILPDGGHVSRSPEALLDAYRLLTMVWDGLIAARIEPPHDLRNARDRIAPMLRFFRHGDGGLFLFHGGLESQPHMIASLLARDEVRGQPFQHARHSGYQRLAAGKSIVVVDCGKLPEGAFSGKAHAGFLAFEFSSGTCRLVVNCGAGGEAGWDEALRATAAHSTLTLADKSAASVLPPGLARDLLGPRLTGGPLEPLSRRSETPAGWTVDASHDAYVADFGMVHERKVSLSSQGTTLTGADRLVPVDANASLKLPFALRFHIHPDVRVS